MVDHLEDVIPQGCAELELLALHELPDRVPGGKEIRVLHGDHDLVAGKRDGDEDIAPEKGVTEALDQISRDRHLFVVRDEARLVEARQGLPDVLFGYLEIAHQHGLHRLLELSGIADGLFQVFVRDDAVADQVIEFGLLPFLRGFLVVEKGDRQDLGDLLRRGLVVGGEAGTALLVDELDDAEQVLVVEDGGGEDLGSPVAGLLVPAPVESQLRTDLLELVVVVGLDDIHHFPGGRAVARDTLLTDRHPDLSHLVAGLEPRDDLFPHPVDYIDGDPVRIEETQDLPLKIDEDVVRIPGGMDPVGNAVQSLLEKELLFEGLLPGGAGVRFFDI